MDTKEKNRTIDRSPSVPGNKYAYIEDIYNFKTIGVHYWRDQQLGYWIRVDFITDYEKESQNLSIRLWY